MNNLRQPGGEIRKLLWELRPSLPFCAIQVGGKVRTETKTYLVCEIVEDKNTFAEYGYFEYLIMVSIDGKKDGQVLHSRITRKPDKIEYFLPDGEHSEEYFI